MQVLPGMKRNMQGQQAVMDLNAAWHHEQLAEAHDVCDKLSQENNLLRAELVKRGIVAGDEHIDEQSFALGGVPDQPRHSSVSFTDSATTSQPGTFDGKRGASDMGDSVVGMRPALLNMARESDAACGELQQMLDRLQSQLTASTSAPSPKASPFAVVAAGSKEDQIKATRKLCGDASTQAVEVSTHLNCLIEALQQAGEGHPDRVSTDATVEQNEQAPAPPPAPAWRNSFEVPAARSSFQADSLPGPPRHSFNFADMAGRPSLDAHSKAKPSVSFQMLDQPAYSANLDTFLPGSQKLEHGLSSFDNDYDTSEMGNPLFDTTMSRERVQGTRGIALTRASVAAQMMRNMSHEDAEAQEQLAQALKGVHQKVCIVTHPQAT